MPFPVFFRHRFKTIKAPFPGLFLLPLLALLLATGCASRVTLTPIDPTKRTLEVSLNALDSKQVSESTLMFLEERDRFRAWKKDPVATLSALFAESGGWKNANHLLALAELCYFQALKEHKPELVERLFLTTAVVAYQAIFNADCDFAAIAYQPGAYIATEYYNRSLARFIIFFRAKGEKIRHGMRHKLLVGELELQGNTTEFIWPAAEIERYIVADEFKIKGLRREGSFSGIGVPLVFLRSNPYQNEEIKIARISSSTLALKISPPKSQAATLVYTAAVEIYDPLVSSQYHDAGKTLPLASDYSTAIAFMLSRAPSINPLKALLAPDAWENLQGLILLQPYEKDKIPVVFVHGLMSSPLTWASMLNRLMSDPELRKRCQFWFYGYPTSNPILYSAANFRKALRDARARFDPQGTDPGFDRLVIVGHSMGGLLARTMVLRSNLQTFREKANIPLDIEQMPQEQRDLLHSVLEFEQLPFVSRILFLATPHRGAHLADSMIGRLGASLITLPFKLLAATSAMLTNLGQQKGTTMLRIGDRKFESMPTGIDGLLPDNPVLLWGAQQMEASRVPFHSIIGNDRQAGVQGGEDGVVPYASAHLANAQSELVVFSEHSVQEKPPTVAEVRRILLEHVGAGLCAK